MPRLLPAAAALVLSILLAACGGGGGGGGGGGAFVAAPAAAPATSTTAQLPAREALIARAQALELKTAYVPPPGDVLEHQTAGYAKTMCSAVFITGLDPDGRGRERRLLHGALRASARRWASPSSTAAGARSESRSRTAPRWWPASSAAQGCVALPAGASDVYFAPVDREDRAARPRHAGLADGRPAARRPAAGRRRHCQGGPGRRRGLRPRPRPTTSAFVVTHKGRHRSASATMQGIGPTTPLESLVDGQERRRRR